MNSASIVPLKTALAAAKGDDVTIVQNAPASTIALIWSRTARTRSNGHHTRDEHAEVVRLVRAAIDDDRYPLSPRVARLKGILAKVDPASIRPAVTPFLPRPTGERSYVLRKEWRARR